MFYYAPRGGPLIDGANMRYSSIGLTTAAVLLIASLTPADAGVAPRQRFISPARAITANHGSRIEHFGERGSDAFRRGRDRQSPLLGWGYPGGSLPSPLADAEPFGFGAGAPIFNVTIVTSPPSQAHARPQSDAAPAGPKIIIVGALSRKTHAAKMPVVVYGRMPL
jgi:hypothetical protein